jgi:membrane-associated phospholipid phosphatase
MQIERGKLKITLLSLVILALTAYIFIPVLEVSFYIFTITYGALISYVLFFRQVEFFASKLMLTYAFILLFRMVTLSILPFRAHDDLVFLQDPFLNEMIYPSKIVTDLFFSGHTAFVAGMFFITRNWLFLFFALLVGSLLVLQRVHYSIDVVAAFPFAFLAFQLANSLIRKLATRI